MKKLFFTIFFATAFVAGGFFLLKSQHKEAGQHSQKETQKAEEARTPAQSNEDWGKFLRDQADAYYRGNNWNPARVYKKLAQDDTSWQGGAWQCLETLKGFALTQVFAGQRNRLPGFNNQHSFRFGFEISDQDYMASKVGKDHYELPRRIQRDLDGSNPEFWNKQDWKKWDGFNGESGNEKWSVLQYRSRTVRNPGGNTRSLQRVLVLREVYENSSHKIPLYDQWIQFTVQPANLSEFDRTPTESRPFDPVGKGVQKLVDFISVRHRENNPVSGEDVVNDGNYIKPLLSFRQFWRDDRGFKPKDRLGATGTLDTCYSCHAGGMRWISPYPSSVWNKKVGSNSDKTQKEVFDHFTNRMDSYGHMSWGKAVTPENYGPPLGRKVGCAVCHNNGEEGSIAAVSRGAINWGFSAGHARHKMGSDASMPMNDRGAHGIARQFVRDYIWGNEKRGIQGDSKRVVHRKWIDGNGDPGGSSGDSPSLSRAVRDLSNNFSSELGIDSERIRQARAAAKIAEKHNSSYRKLLFEGNSYSKYYRRQTHDWLFASCDLEETSDDISLENVQTSNPNPQPQPEAQSQLGGSANQ